HPCISPVLSVLTLFSPSLSLYNILQPLPLSILPSLSFFLSSSLYTTLPLCSPPVSFLLLFSLPSLSSSPPVSFLLLFSLPSLSSSPSLSLPLLFSLSSLYLPITLLLSVLLSLYLSLLSPCLFPSSVLSLC